MAAAPEALPVAERVLLRPLLIPLTALVAYLFMWGLCQSLDSFTRAVFGTAEGIVGWIPLLNRLVERPLHAIEHRISSLVGGAARHFENQFFTRWHALASLLVRWAHDIEYDAIFYYRLAHEVGKLYSLFATGNVKGARAELARLFKVLAHDLNPRVARVEKIATHAAPAAVTRQVGALAGELDHVLEWDLPRLRARTRTIEQSLDRLWHRVKGLDKIVVTTAFVGAVAVALGRMGLGWLRCNSVRNIGKQIGCGGFGLLETLLSDAIEAFIVTDLCDFIDAMGRVAEQFQPVLIGFVDVENVLIGCHGATLPIDLGLPPLALPTVTTPLSLAA